MLRRSQGALQAGNDDIDAVVIPDELPTTNRKGFYFPKHLRLTPPQKTACKRSLTQRCQGCQLSHGKGSQAVLP